ncbi:hypothetical protein [Terrisporobacter petrolearius]|uniref:hypothetical protein n=1 Tax=Terrisporobacter petrolearius TaxID=1460447 RepID=UPI0031CC8AB4
MKEIKGFKIYGICAMVISLLVFIFVSSIYNKSHNERVKLQDELKSVNKEIEHKEENITEWRSEIKRLNDEMGDFKINIEKNKDLL